MENSFPPPDKGFPQLSLPFLPSFGWSGVSGGLFRIFTMAVFFNFLLFPIPDVILSTIISISRPSNKLVFVFLKRLDIYPHTTSILILQ